MMPRFIIDNAPKEMTIGDDCKSMVIHPPEGLLLVTAFFDNPVTGLRTCKKVLCEDKIDIETAIKHYNNYT